MNTHGSPKDKLNLETKKHLNTDRIIFLIWAKTQASAQINK